VFNTPALYHLQFMYLSHFFEQILPRGKNIFLSSVACKSEGKKILVGNKKAIQKKTF